MERWQEIGTSRKRLSPSWVTSDVLTAEGSSIAEAVKTIRMTETTYFR